MYSLSCDWYCFSTWRGSTLPREKCGLHAASSQSARRCASAAIWLPALGGGISNVSSRIGASPLHGMHTYLMRVLLIAAAADSARLAMIEKARVGKKGCGGRGS